MRQLYERPSNLSLSVFQIFQVFEHPVEVENLREVGTLLELERANFVRFIFNGSWNSVTHREGIDRRLKEYEQTVAVAADEGINMADKMPVYQWDYIQSVFFTSTILTTIGVCHFYFQEHNFRVKCYITGAPLGWKMRP